ncbi:hypothetical protein ACOME3_010096 [Neoechinorhynchus agilis]
MPKPSPAPDSQRAAMGFFLHVLSLTTMAVYLIWMFVPDEYFHSSGIYYFPNRYWGIILPFIALAGVICIPIIYGYISMRTIPPDDSVQHLNTIIRVS